MVMQAREGPNDFQKNAWEMFELIKELRVKTREYRE